MFLGVSGGPRGILEGFKEFQERFIGSWAFHEASRGFRGVREVFHGASWGIPGEGTQEFLGVSLGSKDVPAGFRSVPRIFKGSQERFRVFKGFQKISRECQGVPRAFQGYLGTLGAFHDVLGTYMVYQRVV